MWYITVLTILMIYYNKLYIPIYNDHFCNKMLNIYSLCVCWSCFCLAAIATGPGHMIGGGCHWEGGQSLRNLLKTEMNTKATIPTLVR